jgi:hypothetical protein
VFRVSFPTGGPVVSLDEMVRWLNDRGEPCAREDDECVRMRALPVSFGHSHGRLEAAIAVNSAAPLSRLVDALFDLSATAGADVRLEGVGEVTWSELWMLFADEQDRLRLVEALKRAEDLGNHHEIMRRLWSVIHCLRPASDDRWDVHEGRIVELKDGLGSDAVSVPVPGYVHSLAWRWLAEAYPGIAEGNRSR